MIVGVHTDLPAYRDAMLVDKLESPSEWRSDRPVQIPVSWNDYLVAQKPAKIIFDPLEPRVLAIYADARGADSLCLTALN